MNPLRILKRTLKPAYLELRYNGRDRFCPVCERYSSTFREAGSPSRSDAACPFCRSLERHRLFWLYFKRKTNLLFDPPRETLHVAPEPVIEKLFRRSLGSGYKTCDLNGEKVDIQMDIAEIPFGDDEFDLIYCSHVLEHVPDDRKAIREFARTLRPGGLAFLLVPVTSDKTHEDPSITDPQERLRRFGQDDHFRRYGPDYEQRLREEGFYVEKVSGSDFLAPEEIINMGITEAAGDIYICRVI